jgi:branched-chain amino acid transport system substrate-binding protein
MFRMNSGSLAAPGFTSGNKYALVVGVNVSLKAPALAGLKYAQTDAVGISWLLTRPSSGFALVDNAPLVGAGATTTKVRQAIDSLIAGKSKDDLLLFYFIGHSYPLLIGENNPEFYLVTSDFNPEQARRDPSAYLSFRWLRGMLLERNRIASSLIIVDCCSAGNLLVPPLPKEQVSQALETLTKGSHSPGDVPGQPDRSWAVITSTEENAPAYEKIDHRDEGHACMTGSVLDALGGRDQTALDSAGNLTLETLCAYLRERMGEQRFIMNGFLRRAFILARQPADNPLRTSREDFMMNQPRNSGELSFMMNQPRNSGELSLPSVPTLFDALICEHATFDADLDLGHIERFFGKARVLLQEDYRTGVTEREQMESLGFLKNNHPSYGALLCFGKRPWLSLPGAYTQCIYWQGTKPITEDKEKRREIMGNLLEQFTQALDFLHKNLNFSRIIEPGGSSERPEIPFRVLEEALENALIHREYVTEPGHTPRVERVVVEIFSDRIQISSPGAPLVRVEVLQEALQEAVQRSPGSHPRNPQIMRIFYLAGSAENVGSGLIRMQHLTQTAGLRPPHVELNPQTQTFMITLYRPGPEAVAEAETLREAVVSGTPAVSADQDTRQLSASSSSIATLSLGSTGTTQPVPRPHPPRAFRLSWSALVLLAVLLIGLAGGGWGITAWLRGPLAVPAPSPASLLPTQAPISRTIEIASDFPTSGLDTTNGLPLQHGVQMAIDAANNDHLIPGYTLKLVPYDDVGRNSLHDPQTGARNITQAITDGLVAGIIGPENSSVALSELPLANQAPIALVSPTATYPCLTRGGTDDPDCSGSADLQAQLRPSGQVTFFRLATTDDQLGKAMADYLYTTGHYRKALLLKDDSDVYSFGLALPFQHEWSQLGGTLLLLDLPQDQSSVQNYQDLLQTVASIQPDLIYFAGSSPNGSYVLRALSTIASLKTTALAGGDALIDTDFLQVANQVRRTAPIYAGTPIVDPEHAGTAVGANFQDNYNASGYGDYGIYAATAYDCAMALIQAIKQALQRSAPPRGEQDLAGARRFRQAIVQALRHLVLQAGATGRHSFDANGDSTSHTVSFYRLDVSSGQPVWQWIKQVGA